eukprot:scaffold7994_cov122-Isochrysis_galbana.AAC.11
MDCVCRKCVGRSRRPLARTRAAQAAAKPRSPPALPAALASYIYMGNRANSRGPWAGTRGLSKNNSALEATADDRRHIDKDKGTCETGVGRASLSLLRSS